MELNSSARDRILLACIKRTQYVRQHVGASELDTVGNTIAEAWPGPALVIGSFHACQRAECFAVHTFPCSRASFTGMSVAICRHRRFPKITLQRGADVRLFKCHGIGTQRGD